MEKSLRGRVGGTCWKSTLWGAGAVVHWEVALKHLEEVSGCWTHPVGRSSLGKLRCRRRALEKQHAAEAPPEGSPRTKRLRSSREASVDRGGGTCRLLADTGDPVEGPAFTFTERAGEGSRGAERRRLVTAVHSGTS